MTRTTRISFNHELTFATAGPRKRRRRLSIALALLLIVGGLGYALRDEIRARLAATTPTTPETTPQAAKTTAEPAPKPPPVKKVDIEYVVRPNDTLGEIFGQLKLDVTSLPAILNLPEVRDRFKPLQPGDKLIFALENGTLHGIDRRISETEVLSITKHGDGFAADILKTPVTVKTAHVRGTISSSRFVAGRVIGLSPEMIQQLGNDIFAWDIDFARNIRPGDRFNVMYEQKFRGDEYLGDGPIVAAEFINDGAVHRAVHYASPDGKIDGYFTPDGHSVRQQFLRAPLDFTRVNPDTDIAGRRPILNTMGNHGGIDYPAPAGTAVKATGDGQVKFVGAKGEYGNTVIIEHGGGISTLYGQLFSFASGLQIGQRVKQNEIIGYVGSSGAATAPHLHYEYRVDDTYTDPGAVEQAPGAPIPAEYRADFRSKAAALLAALKQPGDAVVTAAITN